MKVQKRLNERRAKITMEKVMEESKIKDETTRQSRIKSFIKEAEEIREAREQEEAREQDREKEAREHDEAREPEEEEEKRNDWNEDENGMKSDEIKLIETKKSSTMTNRRRSK